MVCDSYGKCHIIYIRAFSVVFVNRIRVRDVVYTTGSHEYPLLALIAGPISFQRRVGPAKRSPTNLPGI